MRWFVALGPFAAAAAAALWSPWLGGGIVAAEEGPIEAGPAVIVDPSDPGRELREGGSATAFTLRLPAGATCPGDSANDQWRLETFIAASGLDPAALTYSGTGPIEDGADPLYETTTRRAAAELLPQNPEPGLPVEIPPLPDLSFAVLPPGWLADGRYQIGVACSYFGATGKVWMADIDIVSDPSDSPGQLRWTVPEGAVLDLQSEGTGSTRWIWIAVLAGSAAVIAVVRVRARSQVRTVSRS